MPVFARRAFFLHRALNALRFLAQQSLDFGVPKAAGVPAEVVAGGLLRGGRVSGALEGEDAEVGGVFRAEIAGVLAEERGETSGGAGVVAAIEC